MPRTHRPISVPLVALLLVLGWIPSTSLWGQASSRFKLPSGLQGLAPQGEPGQDLQVSARFQTSQDGGEGLLSVTATLGPGWHIYSVSQPDGGPLRTQIALEPSNDFVLAGSFEPDKRPKVRRLEFYDVPIEEHYEQVTWSAPIVFKSGVAPKRW